MSEKERDERLKKSHWYWFDGKEVLIQLVEGWNAVTYPNVPAFTREVDSNNQPVGVPFVPSMTRQRGTLHVCPDVGPGGVEDVMFVLETVDVDDSKPDCKIFIGIKREFVAYITHCQRSLVQTA